MGKTARDLLEDGREAFRQAVPRLTLTVEEAAKVIGIGRNSAYAAVRCGEIPSVRIGGRILIPRLALERMLVETGLVDRSGGGA